MKKYRIRTFFQMIYYFFCSEKNAAKQLMLMYPITYNESRYLVAEMGKWEAAVALYRKHKKGKDNG